jgi:hypothetical protein
MRLTNDQVGLVRELVLWNLEVEWCWALSDAAGNVVMGAVAWAEPASELTGLANGDASQVCADA